MKTDYNSYVYKTTLSAMKKRVIDDVDFIHTEYTNTGHEAWNKAYHDISVWHGYLAKEKGLMVQSNFQACLKIRFLKEHTNSSLKAGLVQVWLMV